MTDRIFLFAPPTLRQPAAVQARSVFASEFSDHISNRHTREAKEKYAGNLSGMRASISYQPNGALRPAHVFTARPSLEHNDSRRVAFADRSTRNGHSFTSINSNRTTTMFVPALSESSYLFRR